MWLQALPVAVSFMGGAWLGTLAPRVSTPIACAVCVVVGCGAAWAWWIGQRRAATACVMVVCACGGHVLAGRALQAAYFTPLRSVLHTRFGGFRLDTLGPEGAHPPVRVRFQPDEDAVTGPTGVQLRVVVLAVHLENRWVPARGGVLLSVSGTPPPARVAQWRAGRTLEAPVVFRRPARFFNDGVDDSERALAVSGVSLFGSVKSAWLVTPVASGGWLQERAADVRAWVRQVVFAHVAPHSAVSAAIVAAVLIGDRTGLRPELRQRLQAAGVYHVLAISGGNIAILVGLVLAGCRLMLLAPRAATVATLCVLLAYAQIVVAGPSVFRAVVMAALYLAARALDHRTPPWHAIGMAATVSVALGPLDVLDAGFRLTFGATATLLGVASVMAAVPVRTSALRWLIGAVAASMATEVALLPVGAVAFGRVTAAGLLLNLVAIPLMTGVQVGGLALLALDGFASVAPTLGWGVHLAADGLVRTANLLDWAPWLAQRVPPPSALVVVLYYLALLVVIAGRGAWRRAAGAVVVVGAVLIVAGSSSVLRGREAAPGVLRLTMFDVGQGESLWIEWPRGGSMLVDAGGAPFGSGSFDIGDRVLLPALWARGATRLDRMLITHGDPDHVGGGPAVAAELRPRVLVEGIDVPGHTALAALRQSVAGGGGRLHTARAGETWQEGKVRVRVLHPAAPDWERRRVRNDDSVVLELVYGDVAVLLTGDIGVDVERSLLPRLTPAKVRVLKVAHHGSRTSTAQALVDAWRPHVALISSGRGNRFGHPVADVVERLQRAGAAIYRTDRHGAITLTTDGQTVRVRTRL